jgi:hypothetical protein
MAITTEIPLTPGYVRHAMRKSSEYEGYETMLLGALIFGSLLTFTDAAKTD